MSDFQRSPETDEDAHAHPHLVARVSYDIALHQHHLESPKSYEGYEEMYPEVEILVDALLRDYPEITKHLLRLKTLQALDGVHNSDDVFGTSDEEDLIAKELFDLLPLHVQRSARSFENFRESMWQYRSGITGAVVEIRIEHIRVTDGPKQAEIQRAELKSLSTR